MMDLRRNRLAEFVEKEFIGPDPIDFEGYKQENGEEILVSDPPRTRYIAGILFPREVKEMNPLKSKKVKWKTLIYWKWKMTVKFYLDQQEI